MYLLTSCFSISFFSTMREENNDDRTFQRNDQQCSVNNHSTAECQSLRLRLDIVYYK